MPETKDKQTADEAQSIRDELKQLRDDVAALMKTLKEESGEKLHALRERVATAAHDTTGALREKAHVVGESVSQTAHQAKRLAEEHPFKTAIAALCLGLVTGAIIRGRSK